MEDIFAFWELNARIKLQRKNGHILPSWKSVLSNAMTNARIEERQLAIENCDVPDTGIL